MPERTLEKPRTTKQNNSLHLFFTHLADSLNGAGLDMRKTLREGIDIPWNAKSVKEYLWRPIMHSQLGKESTTELTTGEIDQVFDTMNRLLAQKFGLHIEFPSEESMVAAYRAKEGR